MRIEKIKPIPKYVLDKIHKKDLRSYPSQDAHFRFYAYLATNDKELVQITVACKNVRKKWYCKQVIVHGVHSNKCFIKDIKYAFIGGYSVGWYAEGLQKEPRWYEDDKWGCHYDQYFNPWAYVINREYVKKHFEEYKYSAVELAKNKEVLKYLRLYEKFPQMEYITKLGLERLVTSKQILKLAGKDNGFRKYLANNRESIINNYYYIPAIIMAYKKNISLDKAESQVKASIEFRSSSIYQPLREAYKGEYPKLLDYIRIQDTSISSYLDYYNACINLDLDMSLQKNRYPHEFHKWHDIRVDEYASKRAREEAEKRKEFEKKFEETVCKYLSLEYTKQDVYIIKIAQSSADLVKEGEILHHCVGRMGYDQKMARGATLIFFVRTKEAPDKPLVTLEYSPKEKKILQCYGDHDSKPNEDILEFVNKHWLPYTKRQLKKIAV